MHCYRRLISIVTVWIIVVIVVEGGPGRYPSECEGRRRRASSLSKSTHEGWEKTFGMIFGG